MKIILRRKQLEIVTGGWVMVDEATTTYFAIIDQLIEGHQWLNHFTNIIPQHGWSVDVFGHSATLPYIISTAGITDMVILRAHYSWKAFLAKMKWFDFYWEQPFNSPRILCHMGPSDLYSFKHTCGPDPFSCLNYDFRKVGGERSESTAEMITDKNVELKANYLLAQYGRYASLFDHNVLLVPLGDDFRFNVLTEWEQQYANYKKLFSYINGRKDWNARLRFGTVADYFDAVHARLQNSSNLPVISLKGDFFPYADIYANARPSYWTGYYTTRPFYKKLARELEHWLRTAEILYSFAKMIIDGKTNTIILKDYSNLISARQDLALFQHHDAITGTSRKFVMQNYGQKLHSGINNAMTVTSHLTQLLLMKKLYEGNTWTSQVYPDMYRTLWYNPSKKISVLTTNKGRKVIFFNSLTIQRTETVRVKVRTSQITVMDSNGNWIPSQINPAWKDGFSMSNSVFELIFVITMKPLSFSTYTLIKSSETITKEPTKAVISLFLKDDSATSMKNPIFTFEKPKGNEIKLESSKMRATFSSTGVLKQIYMKDSGTTKSVGIDFKAYLPWIYRSGAYLFQPDISEPIPLSNLTDQFPLLCLIRGPIVSELNIIYHSFFKFTIRLFHSELAPSGLQMEISSDISKINKDIELIMRINSDVQNDGIFYTDSNGLQMLRRKYLTKLPVQGNYYPVTTGIYIEDEHVRLNLLVPHSHGVTSPQHGSIEIMLDRKIANDDGRGMSEGVEDSQMVSSTFWLVPESITESSMDSKFPSLSLKSNLLSLCLQYPVITLVTDNGEARITNPDFSFLSDSWPSNVHLVNLRTLPTQEDYTLPSNSSLMVIHEISDSCEKQSFVDSVIKNYNIFSKVSVKSVHKTTLTGTISFLEENFIPSFSTISKLQACKVTFR